MKTANRLWLCLIFLLLLAACSGVKPPKKLHFVVREQPEKIISQKAYYEIFDAQDRIVLRDSTNEFGYFSIKTKRLTKKTERPIEELQVQVKFKDQSAALKLNRYNPIQDIYLNPTPKIGEDQSRVADMHYHVSMRNHNSWGYQFYGVNELKKQVPTNLNWNRLHKNLCVYNEGKWRKPKLSKNHSEVDQHREMKLLLEGEWVRSKDGANSLKNYSQATPPHMLEGNVYLAYNAISPFEHSISNEGIKRLVSSSFKSGANIKWLKTMGGKKGRNFITHWNNFNREYSMITSQDTSFNQYHWSYLRRHDNIVEKTSDSAKALVINVVEGGHILQDKYFPHFIDFNIGRDNTPEKLKLFDDIYDKAQKGKDSSSEDQWVYDYLNTARDILSKENLDLRQQYKRKELKRRYKLSEYQVKIPRVDSVLIRELYHNIDSLKQLDIFMMAIGHLSYNGLTGHAPALDVSKKPFFEKIVSAVVKRAYGNRVSEDKRYRKSFDGLFYTVPGVNKFGDAVINRLLDPEGGRIHIDLKHSDVITRKFILDKYLELDSLPPICSHCGVNGLPVNYNSPFINEYRLLESSLTRKFYTFGINLYNEEVERIVASNGIIGIPLEERVLGGYVDNKIRWAKTILINDGNPKLKDQTVWMKKRKYMLDAVYYASKAWADTFNIITEYYKEALANSGISANKKEIFDLICEEYFSAESFLNNLFHIIDISQKVNQERLKGRAKQNLLVSIENQLEQEEPDRDMKRAWMLQQRMDQMSLKEYQPPKKEVWKAVCLGSDLDGLIDPINVCATASQYPEFKEKLELFIPLFLYVRSTFEQEDPILGTYATYHEYFNDEFTIKEALDMLFYTNLKDFTIKAFNHD